jgi:ribosome-associated heat shock protein Hsp15
VPGVEHQRLDKWLWCARFASTRTACASLAEGGRVRINRQATDKPHAKVRVGDVLTLPLHAGVRVVEVLGLSERRGAAAEARTLYRQIAENDGIV